VAQAERAGGMQLRTNHCHMETHMIIAGLILLLLGLVLGVGILWTIGIVLIIVGAVLWVLGSMNHSVAGRRHYF
jgi:hypothetical protein